MNRLFTYTILFLILFPTTSQAEDLPALPVARFSTQLSESTYTLGPGDGVQILFFNVPELSGLRTVLPDGSISLPLVGSIRAEGLTSDQLSERLSELYQPYLVRSRVSVTVERPRPVTLVISGEVNRPGPRTFQPIQNVTAGTTSFSAPSGLSNASSTSVSTSSPSGAGLVPTSTANIYRVNVSSALDSAGGLTERADVRNVSLVRQLPGGKVLRKTLDLWALLQGDSKQNPSLQDGDTLTIPRTEGKQIDFDYDVVAQSTLSPEQINIQVVGQVQKPGLVTVRNGSPLTTALVAAGGLTNVADPRQVELVRLNRDGTVTRKLIDAKLEQSVDEALNPRLRSSDIIVVRLSTGGELIQGINTVLQPFTQIANLFLLFRAIR